MVEIPVDRVDADPGQPRTEFDPEGLDRLAKSLGDYGQIQPITVRPAGVPGRFVVVTGERRWRASVLAGRPTVAALVVGGPGDDPRRLETQLVENALREDLSPLDQARAFRALLDRNGWTPRQLAETLHLHRTTVTRALRLLDLPEPLRQVVESGRLAPAVAAEIARVDDPDRRRALTARALSENLSRAGVSEIIKKFASPGPRPEAPPPPPARVYRTAGGRITIELDRPGDVYAVVDAVTEVARFLHVELLERKRTGPLPLA